MKNAVGDSLRAAVDENRVTVARRVLVCTPTHSGDVVHECALSMQLATIHCLLRGVLLEWTFAAGFSLIQHGRNWLHQEFLSREDCHYLLWLDADVAFDPDAVVKMMHSLETHGLDAVAGVYTTKHPRSPIFPYESLGPAVDNLQPARKVPGGFLLMSRSAAEAVTANCERYLLEHNGETRESAHVFEVPLVDSQEHPGKKKLLGEDFVLSKRLLDAGKKLYVQTDINFMHLGRHAWRGNLANTLAAEAAAGVTGQGSEDAHQINTARAEAGAA